MSTNAPHPPIVTLKREDGVDPIWGAAASIWTTMHHDLAVDGQRCGRFLCDRDLHDDLKSWNDAAKARLTTRILSLNDSGVDWPEIDNDLLQAAKTGRNISFGDKVEAVFRQAHRLRVRPGRPIPMSEANNAGLFNRMLARIEGTEPRELHDLLQLMIEMGLAQRSGTLTYFTAMGWERLDAMASMPSSDGRQGFVAMWFAEEMAPIYETGIAPAIERAGYRPFRIDGKEHANKIDDEIIAEIRKSHFLVADFTSGTVPGLNRPTSIPRGGVYYEAGFAQGLGIPVIWTVRIDQLEDVHFDIRQYNMVAWTDAADLQQRLYNRIVALLGLHASTR